MKFVAAPVPPTDATSQNAERSRQAIRALMEARGLRAHPWATAAGISSSTLYGFLKRDTDMMSTSVLDKLAAAAGVPIGALMGEAEPVETQVVVRFALRGSAVVRLARPSKHSGPVPPGQAGAQWDLAECQTDVTPLLARGAMVYWRSDRVAAPAQHEGRLCIVTLADEQMVLADLRRGFGKSWLLVTVTGQVMDGCQVSAAAPVEWVRPAAA